jgi:UPF0755 protein
VKRFFSRHTLVAVLLFLFLVGCFFGLLCWQFFATPLVPKQGRHYILKPGTSALRVSRDLTHRGNFLSPWLFDELIRWRDDTRKLQAGEYNLPAHATPLQLLDLIRSGSNVYHSFTLVNGWNIHHVLNALRADTTIKHTLGKKSLASIAKLLHISQKTPEGWLYPETYFYRLNATDLSLLKRAHRAMQVHLQKAWKARAKQLPYKNAYQSLIVASLIEKETGLAREKPVIAAVILSRLKKWMRLQIDAAVIYGLGPRFSLPLTRKELKIKTPYNTYLHYGLPPTPIAMPGKTAIWAALHPAKTNVLYFVAKGDGGHVFSKTLSEQTKAIAKYLLKKK